MGLATIFGVVFCAPLKLSVFLLCCFLNCSCYPLAAVCVWLILFDFLVWFSVFCKISSSLVSVCVCVLVRQCSNLFEAVGWPLATPER